MKKKKIVGLTRMGKRTFEIVLEVLNILVCEAITNTWGRKELHDK